MAAGCSSIALWTKRALIVGQREFKNTCMFSWAKKSSSSGWTAVDPNPDGMCGASVRMPGAGGGKPQVVKCGALSEAQFGAGALAKLARKLAVPNFQWTLPLARGDYKVVVVPEPAVKPAEMADSVRWSMGALLDYPVEESVVDWMSIPTLKYLPQRPPQLYAVAARNTVIRERTETFRRAKMTLNAVDIRETAQRNIAALLETSGEAVGMLAVNEQGVQLTFTFEGELYLDRFIEAPLSTAVAGDDESRTRMFERITLEVQRSLDFLHRTLSFLPIGRIVMVPLPAPIALREHLAQNIAETVEILDLATVFDFSLTPELAAEESQARYFVALGAALRGMAAVH
jgi:MSHA biogenesis protein MshI